MTGSKDLTPSTKGFASIFWDNQFVAQPQWPKPGTSLHGQTAIVTGSNTGLGLEASGQLLDLKLSRLIMAVRSLDKGEVAARKLRQSHQGAIVDVWELDMCSYDSIQRFSRRVEAELLHVDYVLLNAGGLGLTYRPVEDTGHVDCMQVNYISTALLTLLLLPILKAKRGSSKHVPRLSIVNAALSLVAKFPNRDGVPLLKSFDDKEFYNPKECYHSSKMLAHMFLWHLVDYVSPDDVIISLADPAWCRGTEIARDLPGLGQIAVKIFGLTGRTPRVGASCFIDALVNKGPESHGAFLMSWKSHPFASMLYTPEGRRLSDRVWEETLDELQFAHVRDIVKQMQA